MSNTDKASNGRYTVSTEEEEEEDEDFIDDSEVEELFQQQDTAGLGQGQHRLFIVHPDVKWGSRKQHLTTGESCLHPRSVHEFQADLKLVQVQSDVVGEKCFRAAFWQPDSPDACWGILLGPH